MTATVTCEDCRYFRRDDINPEVGLGFCTLRKFAKYPLAPHYCRQREAQDDGSDTPRNDA